MSTAAVPEPAGSRPALAVISTCEACRRKVIEIRDRFGRPRVFDCGDDGKAVRDPAGQWWAAKVDGRWCVVRPQPGEDPPASGGGVRYRGHGCTVGGEDLVRSRLGGEAVVAPTWEDTSGMCAGMCGAVVPNRFGPNAELLCRECGPVLVRWRSAPQGSIPYGRWVGGVYVHPTQP